MCASPFLLALHLLFTNQILSVLAVSCTNCVFYNLTEKCEESSQSDRESSLTLAFYSS
jgi:hypothetical protein